MKLIITLGFAALVLGGCTTNDYGPKATDEEIKNALTKVGNCLFNEAVELDDHISDAETIAISSMVKCRRLNDIYLQLSLQGSSPSVMRSVLSSPQINEMYREHAVHEVLRWRKAFKKGLQE